MYALGKKRKGKERQQLPKGWRARWHHELDINLWTLSKWLTFRLLGSTTYGYQPVNQALLVRYQCEARKMCCTVCKSCGAVLASRRAGVGICTLLPAWRRWAAQPRGTRVTIVTRACANLLQQHLHSSFFLPSILLLFLDLISSPTATVFLLVL